jgi:ubiquinone/menaquinone biosynthesis C-methylase UbiE
MPIDYRTDKRYRHLTPEQVQEIYIQEKALAEQLLAAPRNKRSEVFLWAYDELFRRCPWHPALTEKSGLDRPDLIEHRVQKFLRLLPEPATLLNILEVGCGNGELSIGLSKHVERYVGVDVSEERIKRLRKTQHETLSFRHVEGTKMPFSDEEFDIAISMQLFEHLHPEDASVHLSEIYRVLKPGGHYFIETPNKWVGPHDISRFFSDTPEGFHLKEYSINELVTLIKESGFDRVSVVTWWEREYSAFIARSIERIWSILPKEIRRQRTFGLHNPLYIAGKSL